MPIAKDLWKYQSYYQTKRQLSYESIDNQIHEKDIDNLVRDNGRNMIDSLTIKKDLKQMNQILKGIPFTRLNISLKVIIESDDNDFNNSKDKINVIHPHNHIR